MNSPTFLKSCSTKPLEVRAGEPNLRPLGRKALLSPKQRDACEKVRMAVWGDHLQWLYSHSHIHSKGYTTMQAKLHLPYHCILVLKHITWASILITGNSTSLQNLLSSSSITSFITQVQQDQMVVRATYTHTHRDKSIKKNTQTHTVKL